MTLQLTDIQVQELTGTEGEIYQQGMNYTWSIKVSIFLSYDTTIVMSYGSIFPDFKYIINREEYMTLKGTIVEPNLYLPAIPSVYPETSGSAQDPTNAKLSVVARIAEVVKNDFVWETASESSYNIQINFFFSTQEDSANASSVINKLTGNLHGDSFV